MDQAYLGKRVVVTTPIRFNDNCTKLNVTSNGKWKSVDHCIPALIVNEHILYFTRKNIFYFVDKDQTGNGQGVVLNLRGGSGSKTVGNYKYSVRVSAKGNKLKAELKAKPLSKEAVTFEWKIVTSIILKAGKCTASSRLASAKASIVSPDIKYRKKGRSSITGPEACFVRTGR